MHVRIFPCKTLSLTTHHAGVALHSFAVSEILPRLRNLFMKTFVLKLSDRMNAAFVTQHMFIMRGRAVVCVPLAALGCSRLPQHT